MSMQEDFPFLKFLQTKNLVETENLFCYDLYYTVA